jgi:hypothetical protein
MPPSTSSDSCLGSRNSADRAVLILPGSKKASKKRKKGREKTHPHPHPQHAVPQSALLKPHRQHSQWLSHLSSCVSCQLFSSSCVTGASINTHLSSYDSCSSVCQSMQAAPVPICRCALHWQLIKKRMMRPANFPSLVLQELKQCYSTCSQCCHFFPCVTDAQSHRTGRSMLPELF